MENQMASKTVQATIAATALLAFSACGGASGEEDSGGDREVTIGWVAPDSTGVFKTATDYFKAAADEAAEAGFDVEILNQSPTGGQTDSGGMARIIENMVSQQVDVLMISPADTEAIKPAVRQANDAGIPVVYINLLEDQEGIDIASFIGYDNNAAAKVAAYSVLDYYGGPGVQGAGEKVDVPADQYLDLEFWEDLYQDVDRASITARGVIIEGLKGSFYSNERVDGFMSVVDEYPGVEVLGVQPGDWNREAGATTAENFLAKHPQGQLDFMWAASNEMALGAINVAERTSRIDDTGSEEPAEGKVAIFTNDLTPESTDAIRQGTLIAETTHGFADWGWLGTEVGVRLACGLTVEEKIDIRPRVAYQGNVDQFFPQPALPEIDWQSIRSECSE
jgi:ribose transport system substrate-binding protein